MNCLVGGTLLSLSITVELLSDACVHSFGAASTLLSESGYHRPFHDTFST